MTFKSTKNLVAKLWWFTVMNESLKKNELKNSRGIQDYSDTVFDLKKKKKKCL